MGATYTFTQLSVFPASGEDSTSVEVCTWHPSFSLPSDSFVSAGESGCLVPLDILDISDQYHPSEAL